MSSGRNRQRDDAMFRTPGAGNAQAVGGICGMAAAKGAAAEMDATPGVWRPDARIGSARILMANICAHHSQIYSSRNSTSDKELCQTKIFTKIHKNLHPCRRSDISPGFSDGDSTAGHQRRRPLAPFHPRRKGYGEGAPVRPNRFSGCWAAPKRVRLSARRPTAPQPPSGSPRQSSSAPPGR